MQRLISFLTTLCLLVNTVPSDRIPVKVSPDERILICNQAEHVHTDSCNEEGNLVCEVNEHTHSSSCYAQETIVEKVTEQLSEEKTNEVTEDVTDEVQEDTYEEVTEEILQEAMEEIHEEEPVISEEITNESIVEEVPEELSEMTAEASEEIVTSDEIERNYYVVTDLSDCVGSFKLYDSKGNLIPLDGSAKVNTNDVYKFEFYFEETANGAQWADTVTYTLPKGMEFNTDVDRAIAFKGSEDIVAHLHVDKGTGVMTIKFEQKEDKDGNMVPWPDLSLESELTCEMEGRFTRTESTEDRKIDIGAGVIVDVEVESKSVLNIVKTYIDESFDKNTHTAKYMIKVTATGKVENVKVKDTLDKYMRLVEESLMVNGQPASATVNNNIFTVDLGTMEDGETVVITYDAKVQDELLYSNQKLNRTFTNTAEAGGNNVDTVKDSSKFTTTQEFLQKSGKVQKVDGKDYILWDIKLNLRGIDSSKVTVIDVLDDRQTLANPYEWKDPIKVVWTFKDETSAEAWVGDLSNIAVPADVVEGHIYLYTEMTEKPGISDITYSNTAKVLWENGKEWKVTGNVKVAGSGTGVSISKTMLDNGTEKPGYLTYEITAHVPAGMNEKGVVYFVDYLRTYSQSALFHQGLKEEDFTILVNGEEFKDFHIYLSTNTEFYIYFGNALKSSVWPFAEATEVVIRYSVPRAVLDKTKVELEHYLEAGEIIQNLIYIKYGEYGKESSKNASYLYKEESVTKIDKGLLKMDLDTHEMQYEVTFNAGLDTEIKNVQGEGAYGSASFEDTFDKRLEYVAGSFKIERWSKDGKKLEDTYTAVDGNSIVVENGRISVDFSLMQNKNKTKLNNVLRTDRIYKATYKLRIKDSEYEDVMASRTSYVLFDNEAKIITNGAEDFDVYTTAYPTGILSKDSKLKDGDILVYTVRFNESETAYTTSNNTLHLVDTVLSDNLSLKPETIHVYAIKNGEQTELKNCYTIKDGGKVIVFDVPDETYIKIVYEEKVIDSGKGVQVDNKIELEGYETITVVDEQKVDITVSDASAYGDHGSFTLFKTNKDTGEPLKGASFKLYTSKENAVNKKDSITYKDKKYYCALEFTTNENGWATIDHVVLTLKDADTYLLVETAAPDNFELDETPIPFVFNPKEGTTPKVFVKNGGSMVVENNHKKISVSGKKTWNDNGDEFGNRPQYITVTLLKNGTEYTSQKVYGPDWKWTFTGLPKYEDGKEIEYTVKEADVPGYQAEAKGMNLVNTPTFTRLEGFKSWNDNDNQDGKRPESITVNLYKNGETRPCMTTTTDKDHEWKWSFENLPTHENGQEIKYTFDEVKVEYYETTYNGTEIINTHEPELRDITVTKLWDDENDIEHIRPEEIEVYLYADGSLIDTVHLTKDNFTGTKEVPGFTYTLDVWTYTWKDLPKYKDGKEIKYTVGEKELEDYDTEINGFVIENYRFVQHYYEGSLKITKIYMESHKEKKTNKIFYVQLFEDEAMKQPYTSIVPIVMNGKSRETIELTVALGDMGTPKTYYVAEVTSDGKIVKSNGKLTVTIDNPSPEVTMEIVPEVTVTNDYDPNVDTADVTSSAQWIFVMLAACIGLISLMELRKKSFANK
ncbi:MAG: Cna B-type domain-containing protein [Erysipelotrichaceae bacterium]|nr:Cna B-type domain-containing protein [Erysipelotrichaceae bacterium]